MSKTTLKIESETLRQLKIRKAVLDFDSYDDLILYILKFAPNDYVEAKKRPSTPTLKEEENVKKLRLKLIQELGLKEAL